MSDDIVKNGKYDRVYYRIFSRFGVKHVEYHGTSMDMEDGTILFRPLFAVEAKMDDIVSECGSVAEWMEGYDRSGILNKCVEHDASMLDGFYAGMYGERLPGEPLDPEEVTPDTPEGGYWWPSRIEPRRNLSFDELGEVVRRAQDLSGPGTPIAPPSRQGHRVL